MLIAGAFAYPELFALTAATLLELTWIPDDAITCPLPATVRAPAADGSSRISDSGEVGAIIPRAVALA